jgi:hypothetical protein
MTDERTMDRLIAHLRVHVAELRPLEDQGAGPRGLEERKLLITRLQIQLAAAVRDRVGVPAGCRPTRVDAGA